MKKVIFVVGNRLNAWDLKRVKMIRQLCDGPDFLEVSIFWEDPRKAFEAALEAISTQVTDDSLVLHYGSNLHLLSNGLPCYSLNIAHLWIGLDTAITGEGSSSLKGEMTMAMFIGSLKGIVEKCKTETGTVKI